MTTERNNPDDSESQGGNGKDKIFVGPRTTMLWAGKQLPADRADRGFYRVSGSSGSGKTLITKLFILDAMREVESNPDAKLIVFEPHGEFYAWICSLNPARPVYYFMPGDTRSVALDFTRDFSEPVDCLTLAQAFHPEDNREDNRFFGDASRTIFAQIFDSIKSLLGYVDLRLMCLVLEDKSLTLKLLSENPSFAQAKELLISNEGHESELSRSILARVDRMKILAAHLDEAKNLTGDSNLFSLTEFLTRPNAGTFVISKQAQFETQQNPINGILVQRIAELSEKMQPKHGRKIFVVIDELQTIADDQPCLGIKNMLLRLRSRGVTILITYQSLITLKRLYGDEALEILGQCSNAIYLKQPDIESARYASEDLGLKMKAESLQELPTASSSRGIVGVAKSSEGGPTAWDFHYRPEFIDKIPTTKANIMPFVGRNADSQRLRGLTALEREKLGEPRKSDSENDSSSD